ncbi:unnamed protein product [Sphenostylis stenocarpa]|uniref:LOB domain-containing protein n=1 Tax=Sphenostylis stenocarpa TaxID=92480 RepID=A0AA86SQS5_9FABA|nr:unnamed protein product [Sphenostylis stenocarpa]
MKAPLAALSIAGSMESGTITSRTTSQACAACRYQRRKCGPNCILAPFFPHHRHKQFRHAHRLFGVGKITNMIKPLEPHNRNMAIATILFESDMRAKDPVGGCSRILQRLNSQIASAQAELQLVLQHLALFRAQAHHNSNAPIPPSPSPSPSFLPTSSPYPGQIRLQEQQHHHAYNLHEDMNMMDPHNPIA